MNDEWHRLPFDSVIEDESGGNTKTPQAEFLNEGEFPVVDQGKELVAGYINERSRLCRSQLPVIVFGDHTRCFKYVDFPFCMGADGVKVLRPKVDADVKYLYYYLRQIQLPDGGYDRHFKYLKRAEVVLPPLAEQQRIVGVLDRADLLCSKRRQAIAELDVFVRSLFLDIFGDPATNSKGWPTKAIGEMGKVVTGNTPPRENPEYYGAHIEWIKSDNINTPDYYLTRATESLSESGKTVARTVPSGSILVTCIAGSPSCIGNAAMTDREVAFNQQINALVPTDGDPHFIYVQMLVGKRLIQEASTGGMKGMVSKSRFEQIRLMFPPITMQRAFSNQVMLVEKLRSTHRTSQEELEALFDSLQNRAFEGGL